MIDQSAQFRPHRRAKWYDKQAKQLREHYTSVQILSYVPPFVQPETTLFINAPCFYVGENGRRYVSLRRVTIDRTHGRVIFAWESEFGPVCRTPYSLDASEDGVSSHFLDGLVEYVTWLYAEGHHHDLHLVVELSEYGDPVSLYGLRDEDIEGFGIHRATSDVFEAWPVSGLEELPKVEVDLPKQTCVDKPFFPKDAYKTGVSRSVDAKFYREVKEGDINPDAEVPKIATVYPTIGDADQLFVFGSSRASDTTKEQRETTQSTIPPKVLDRLVFVVKEPHHDKVTRRLTRAYYNAQYDWVRSLPLFDAFSAIVDEDRRGLTQVRVVGFSLSTEPDKDGVLQLVLYRPFAPGEIPDVNAPTRLTLSFFDPERNLYLSILDVVTLSHDFAKPLAELLDRRNETDFELFFDRDYQVLELSRKVAIGLKF